MVASRKVVWVRKLLYPVQPELPKLSQLCVMGSRGSLALLFTLDTDRCLKLCLHSCLCSHFNCLWWGIWCKVSLCQLDMKSLTWLWTVYVSVLPCESYYITKKNIYFNLLFTKKFVSHVLELQLKVWLKYVFVVFTLIFVSFFSSRL